MIWFLIGLFVGIPIGMAILIAIVNDTGPKF